MARIKVFDTTTQTWVYADKSFGRDGESITITNITESSDDGGSNVVEFSDGKTVTIKNGKKGANGKNPVKDVDYWTDADQEAMVQQVITALGTPVFGRVEEGNKIITTGNLAAGTYEYWFEDENGKQVFVGTLDHNGEDEPTYTNLLNTYLIGRDIRFSKTNGAPWTKECPGAILVAIPFADIMEKTLRIKSPHIMSALPGGFRTQFNVTNSTTFLGYAFNINDGNIGNATCAVNEGNNTYSFEFIDDNVIAPYVSTNTLYVHIVVNDTATAVTDDELSQVVITIDEPIV